MANENFAGKACISFPAAADLSSYQFRFVKLNSSGQVALCGDGQLACGVLQNKPSAAGQPASVAPLDGRLTKVVVGANLAAAANVASDANGKAVAATTGEYILGQIADAGTKADGQITTLFAQLADISA